MPRITRQCEHRDGTGRCHKFVHLPAVPAADTKVLCNTHLRKSAGPGRPPRYGEPTVTANVRLPLSLYNSIVQVAHASGESISGVIVQQLRERDAQEIG